MRKFDFNECINLSDKENEIKIEDNQPKKKTNKNHSISELESSLTDPEIIALREMGNWRGKVTDQSKKRKVSKYLGRRMDEISDVLKSKPKKKISLLKNGSCLTLQMKLEGKSVRVGPV